MATTSQLADDASTVALYHMDGTVGSVGKKADTHSNNLVETGAGLSAVTGQIVPTSNGAYQMSVSGNYLNTTSTMNLGAGAYSVEFWLKTTYAGTGAEVITTYSAATNYVDIEMNNGAGTGKMNYQMKPNGQVAISLNGTTVINDGNWHFIAMTYDASGTNSLKGYVDGVLDVQGGAGTAAVDVGTFYFFANSTGASGPNAATALDECRFSNVARSAASISSYYNGAAASPAFLINMMV